MSVSTDFSGFLTSCGVVLHNPGVKIYMGVTDGEWSRFLAERPHLTEVNFWRPSGDRAFRVLDPGEPFFFKSRYPHNRVIGGGFYSGFAQLSISEAWELYGEGNGTADLSAMRASIGRYRKKHMMVGEDPIIGCVLLRDVRFFSTDSDAAPPLNFPSNIVQGKSFDLASDPEADYFKSLVFRLLGHEVRVDFSEPWHRDGPVYGDPRLAPRRLGQQAFKAVVLGAYDRRCAITGTAIRPVLEAAHIRPVSKGGEHRIDNGLLLRSDVHTMFDRGYLGIDSECRLMVSARIREEFGNGDQFYQRAGCLVNLPARRSDQPNPDFLDWHMDNVFN